MEDSRSKMGGEQKMVFVIHCQMVEALPFRSREIDRSNLL